MITHCPKCGEEIPRSTQRIGTEILGAFFKDYGGPDKLGRDMSEELKEAKGHGRSLLQGRLLNLVESEDRARARQQELEDFTRAQERAIVLEQTMYLIEHEDGFLEKLLSIASKRKLIPHVIEAEVA